MVLCQGIAPWMLKWVVEGCLLTIHNNSWKSAHAESVQQLNQSAIEFGDCVLPPSTSAFFGGMRRTRVDRDRAPPPTPVSFWRVVGARVCDALEARVLVASRVRSYCCPQKQWRNVSCMSYIAHSATLDG